MVSQIRDRRRILTNSALPEQWYVSFEIEGENLQFVLFLANGKSASRSRENTSKECFSLPMVSQLRDRGRKLPKNALHGQWLSELRDRGRILPNCALPGQWWADEF